MADDETIRIVVEAVDLASAKLKAVSALVARDMADIRRQTQGYDQDLSKTQTNVERFTNLLERLGQQQRDISRSTEGTTVSMQRFADAKDRSADSGERLATAFMLISRGMRAMEDSMGRLDPYFGRHIQRLQIAERSTSEWGTSLQTTARTLEAFGHVVSDTTSHLEDHDRELRSKRDDTDHWNTSLTGMGRTMVQFNNLLQRFTGSLRDHDRTLESVEQRYSNLNTRMQLVSRTGGDIERSFQRTEIAARSAGDGMWNFGRSVDDVHEKKTKLERNLDRDMPAAVDKTSRSLLGAIGTFAAFGARIAAVSAATVGILNLVGAASAGIIGLTSALSSLVGVAEVVPAALASIGGSIAAVTTIFQPAISSVEQYLQAVNKAQDPTAQTAAGPSNIQQARDNAAQQIGDAERNLHRQRVDAAMQMQDLERRLYELRLHNTQQVADAERAVRQAELSGLEQIIAAEERLHQLRMQDRAQETQLEAALANAQASAAGEAARGGAGQAVAQAAVQQAQDTLDQFRQQASGNEAVAQGQVTSARENRNQNVQDAQRNLRRTIQDNAQQIQDLERQITEQRIQNTRSVADAERALARARVQGAREVAAAERSANTQMSNAKAILAGMTPLQRELALSIEHIVSRWKELTAPARNRFLELAIDLVNRVNAHLPQLANLVSHYADMITGLGRGVMNRVFRPQEFQRLTGFANQQATNTGIAGQGAIAGLDALTTVATSRGGEEFLRWLAEATRRVGRFIDQLAHLQDRRDGFTHFFEAARTTLSQVARIFWNLGDAFAHIFEVGFKPGSGFLGGIQHLTKEFDNWTKSQGGKNSLRSFLETGFQSLHQWARILGPITKAVGELVVQMTAWTPLIKLAADFLAFMFSTPVLGQGVGLVFAFATAWSLVGAALPGNQRTLSRVADILTTVGSKVGWLTARLLAMSGVFEIEGSAAGALATIFGQELFFSLTTAGLAFEGFGVSVEIGLLPLLAIVGAVVAVIAIFAILYLKWQPFHHIVNEIAGVVKDILIDAFHLLVKALGFVLDHWQAFLIVFAGPVGAFVDFIYNHFDTIKKIISNLWSDSIGFIKKVWNDLVDWFNGNSTLAQAIHSMMGVVEDVWHKAWGAIYKIAQDVWNGFADGVNFVLRIVGSHDRLPKLGDLGGSNDSTGPSHPVGGPGRFHGNVVPQAAQGGRFDAVPGGMIHIVEAGAPEYVISTDPRYRQRSLGLIIEALNELGVPIPKFQHGGRASAAPPTSVIRVAPGIDASGLTPALKFLGAWVSDHGGLITSTTGGVHANNSYHYRGEAIDIAAPGYNSPWIWRNLHARDRAFVELFGPTYMPGGGGLFHYGSEFQDSALQAEHQNHIHSAFTGTLADITKVLQGTGNGGILGSILGAINPLNALHWVEDHIPGFGDLSGKFGQLGGWLKSIGAFARDKIIGFIKNAPGLLAKVAEHIGGSVLDAVGSVLSDTQVANELNRGQAYALRGISGDNPRANQLRARILAQGLYGWGEDQFSYLVRLWNQESGWSSSARNPSTNAQGIPQLLPSQHPGPHPGFPDWPPIDPIKQILWGLSYIRGRKDERTPHGAWQHELAYNWYDFGGEVMSPLGTAMPAIVHGGEWIINRMQQMRLAQLFGSWDRAKQYLFTTQAPSYGSLYPHAAGPRPTGATGSVNQTFILHEVQPQTDMDYIMRKAEIHMRNHP